MIDDESPDSGYNTIGLNSLPHYNQQNISDPVCKVDYSVHKSVCKIYDDNSSLQINNLDPTHDNVLLTATTLASMINSNNVSSNVTTQTELVDTSLNQQTLPTETYNYTHPTLTNNLIDEPEHNMTNYKVSITLNSNVISTNNGKHATDYIDLCNEQNCKLKKQKINMNNDNMTKDMEIDNQSDNANENLSSNTHIRVNNVVTSVDSFDNNDLTAHTNDIMTEDSISKLDVNMDIGRQKTSSVQRSNDQQLANCVDNSCHKSTEENKHNVNMIQTSHSLDNESVLLNDEPGTVDIEDSNDNNHPVPLQINEMVAGTIIEHTNSVEDCIKSTKRDEAFKTDSNYECDQQGKSTANESNYSSSDNDNDSVITQDVSKSLDNVTISHKGYEDTTDSYEQCKILESGSNYGTHIKGNITNKFDDTSTNTIDDPEPVIPSIPVNVTVRLSNKVKPFNNNVSHQLHSNAVSIQDKIKKNYDFLHNLRFFHDHELTGIKRYQFSKGVITNIYKFFKDSYDINKKKLCSIKSSVEVGIEIKKDQNH